MKNQQYRKIKNTLQFFHKKQMMEILDFLGKIYLDMLKCFTIIKMRLNDKNLENFRNINEDDFKKNVKNNKYFLDKLIEKIKELCNDYKDSLKRKK